MFKIKEIRPPEGAIELTAHDYIQSTIENRRKIRSVAEIIVQACGTFVSACFVVLFFLIKEEQSELAGWAVGCLFIAALLLCVSMLSAIVAASVGKPQVSGTYEAQFRNESLLYFSERRWLRRSVISLMCAMLFFSASLCLYAVSRGYLMAMLQKILR